MSEKKLTPKQRRFALAYAEVLNASEAARRAGYSQKNADVVGPRLLGNAGIRAFIDETLREAERKAGLTVQRLEKELAMVAFCDPRRAFGPDGRLLPVHEMPEDVARALAGHDVEELLEGRGEDRRQVGNTVKLRWCDKVAAIRLGLLRRGALVEKHEHAGPPGTVSITFGIKPRAQQAAPASTRTAEAP